MRISALECLAVAVLASGIGPAWGGYAVGTVTGSGKYGYADGPIPVAEFTNTSALVQDGLGNLLVADMHRIRKIAPDGAVSTLTGTPEAGYRDGSVDSAQFNAISGLWLLPDGGLLISDSWNHRIRKLSKDGRVTTVAGSGPVGYENGGYADGAADSARFNYPLRIAVDKAGGILVVEVLGNRLRRIDTAGRVSTVAGDGVAGFRDGPAATARFNQPFGLALGPDGAVYIADKVNDRIRKFSDGEVSTVVGTVHGIDEPCDVALDSAGGLVIAGQLNNKIFRFQEGRFETLAGSTLGYQDGAGAIAKFHAPQTLLVGRDGVIYVGEYRGLRIRKLFQEKPDCIESRFEGCWAFALSSGHSGKLCLNLQERTFKGFVLWDDSHWGRIEGHWAGDSVVFDLTSNVVPEPAWVGHYVGLLGPNGFTLYGGSDAGFPLQQWAAARDLESPVALAPRPAIGSQPDRRQWGASTRVRLPGPSGRWFDLRGRQQPDAASPR